MSNIVPVIELRRYYAEINADRVTLALTYDGRYMHATYAPTGVLSVDLHERAKALDWLRQHFKERFGWEPELEVVERHTAFGTGAHIPPVCSDVHVRRVVIAGRRGGKMNALARRAMEPASEELNWLQRALRWLSGR